MVTSNTGSLFAIMTSATIKLEREVTESYTYETPFSQPCMPYCPLVVCSTNFCVIKNFGKLSELLVGEMRVASIG